MALRLLHTADWQIGRSYTQFEPDDAAALAEARFLVVERIAGYAVQCAADAVLVAGDVFDAQTVSDRTIRRLFNALSGYSGPWIMISGNHDAALSESVWTRALSLGVVPDNVYLALEPAVLTLDVLRLAILPAPLTQRHSAADLTAWFDHADTPDGYWRIGMAHGSVQGLLADTVVSHNPVAAGRAAAAHLDYLALGDWHGMREVDERTWYSGTPETDRFRNNESGHILDIELSEPGAVPVVTPVRTGHYTWQSWGVGLHVPSDVDNLVGQLQALAGQDVLFLTLTGSVDLAAQSRLADGLGAAEARLRALLCDRTHLHLQPTDNDIAGLHADGYLADVLQTLQAMQATDTGSQDAASRTPDSAIAARDALVLLASILHEVQG